MGKGWRNQCGGLNELPQPVDAPVLPELEPQLEAVLSTTAETDPLATVENGPLPQQ